MQEQWAKNVYWMYGIVLDRSLEIDAEEMAKRLLRHDVMTRPFFLGMHEQPVFRDRGMYAHEQYPVAEYIARYGLYVPSGLALTEDQLDKVCDAIEDVLKN
mgnify:FL=1